MSSQVLFLDEAAVQSSLPLDKLISEVETCLARFSDSPSGGIVQPVRSVVSIEEVGGSFLLMPAYSVKDQWMSAKLLTFFPQNEVKYKKPAIQAIVTLFDATSGTPRAVLDGNAITGLRTAAATAVAVKHMSRENDDVLAIIGTGLQAETHFKLLRLVRNFKEVRVYGRSLEKAKKLAEKYGAVACETVEGAVKDAGVIVTVTTATDPVLFGRWVKPGALVNIVGANFPNTREVDDELMLSSQIIADTREGAAKEAGDIIESKVSIDGELGEIIIGVKTADWSRTRVFKSQGFAAEDLVAAKLVVETRSG